MHDLQQIICRPDWRQLTLNFRERHRYKITNPPPPQSAYTLHIQWPYSRQDGTSFMGHTRNVYIACMYSVCYELYLLLRNFYFSIVFHVIVEF